MIRAVIIDDEERARITLSEMIRLYTDTITVVAQAEDVKSGIEAIRTHQPQLVFLDIKMPDGSGFDLLQKLDKINFEVVFVTAYEEYAIKAFKFSALDYLLKPINPDELVRAVASAEQTLNREHLDLKLETLFANTAAGSTSRSKKIILKTSEDIYVINVEDIIRCESDGNYTTIFLNNGKKIIVSKILKEYEELLGGHGFIRLHQSHLININYFDRFHKMDGGYVILKDKSEIPVSSRKKEQLLKMLEQL